VPELPPPPAQHPALADRLLELARARPKVAASLTLAASAVVGACVLLVSLRGAPPQPELLIPRAATPTSAVAQELYVHVAGAVARPGLYRVRVGSRVADVLDAAGGPTGDGDVHQLNLATKVDDGQRVYVPRVGEPPPAASDSGGGAGEAAGPLDLNTATQAQLEELPGVGPSTAKAILDYREKNGRFRAVEELLDVRGIGPAKFSEIEPLVKV
jgi:competence protein ComEA